MNWRAPVIIGAGGILSAALLVADLLLAQVQRHLMFVSGWIFVLGLIVLALFLRHNDRELQVGGADGFRCRCAFSTAVFLLLIASQLVFHRYQLPHGVFSGFLFVLFLTVIMSGVVMRRAEHKLRLVVQDWDENSEIVRADTKDTYSKARSIHFGFVVAALPVAILNGVLIHAHGALSNLVEKGAS